MSECNHDCSACKSKCGEAGAAANPFYVAPNALSNVKHVIGVVSGKGGVGKSIVTSMLAVAMQRAGYKSAILDADITGPSIPKAFGIHQPEVYGDESGMIPPLTAHDPQKREDFSQSPPLQCAYNSHRYGTFTTFLPRCDRVCQ